MKKLLSLVLVLVLCGVVYSAPDNSMSISTPSGGETISSSDETTRYNEITSKFNAHNHTGTTEVGTIITGTWNATEIAVLYGGTGATTASGARTNLSAASSGANSDITSLSALSTPLSVVQGGTGQANLTNLIALTTHTTGNYVATVAAGAGITIAEGDSEGATKTVVSTLGTTVSLTAEVTGTLPVANGGTNQTTSGLAFGGKIVSYTGNGSDDRNIAHGLGRTPIFVHLLSTDSSATLAPHIWCTGFAAGYSRSTSAANLDRIQSVDGTNVQIGANSEANQDGKTFALFVI